MNPPNRSGRQQLPLGLRWRDVSAFDNFVPGRNREAVERAAALARAEHAGPQDWIYFWGEPGTGKTHLLEAACQVAANAGQSPFYLSLREIDGLSPSMLDGIERSSPVCLDDLESVAGHDNWERALFALYERLRVAGGTLFAAGRRNPASLGIGLRDLATRLGAGLVYQLLPLSDDDKVAALRLRATRRGFELGEDAGRYLLGRYPRDTHSLFSLLDRIDNATLAAQRRVTVPFLRHLE